MESLDKLRKWANCRFSVQQINLDGMSAALSESSCAYVNNIADEIEAEIVERYLLLPVDADGVPIHVGDKMEREGQQFIVCAVAPAVIHSWVAGRKLGEGSTTVGYRPEDCRHVKPRTLEDVLRDMGEEVWNACCESQTTWSDSGLDGIEKRYADELRSIGVGE